MRRVHSASLVVLLCGCVLLSFGSQEFPVGSVASHRFESDVRDLAVSPTGEFLAVATRNELVVLDVSTGARVGGYHRSLDHWAWMMEFSSVEFDLTGRYLMVSLWDPRVETYAPDILVFDTRSFREWVYPVADLSASWPERPKVHRILDFKVTPLGDWIAWIDNWPSPYLWLYDVSGVYTNGLWTQGFGQYMQGKDIGRRYLLTPRDYPYTRASNPTRTTAFAVNGAGTLLAVGGQMAPREPSIQITDLTLRAPYEGNPRNIASPGFLYEVGPNEVGIAVVIDARAAHTGLIGCLAFHPILPILASGELASFLGEGFSWTDTKRPTCVALWDAETGKLIGKMEMSKSDITAVAFSATGDLLAAMDRYGRISVWCTSSGELLSTLCIEPDRSNCEREYSTYGGEFSKLVFDPSDRYIFFSCSKWLFRWELPGWFTGIYK